MLLTATSITLNAATVSASSTPYSSRGIEPSIKNINGESWRPTRKRTVSIKLDGGLQWSKEDLKSLIGETNKLTEE